ncbi:hypothetical protein PU629_07440 [Pullulanibacillus sp. KACC 23026]|uniref:hypothetical protein n=1 Tax=Pullulanibacillus sp. KACC 23026 TaxID=3028315 RepID=UPI0023AFA9E6|nr:hypothetical protein [Pullulanibacillus sp. KACC 23026]WEG14191.1 hypothetical protein PU629_07440 [Pullulanibacillus sp. KACC 23026]
MLTISLIGGCLFITSELLKNRGYTQLSKGIYPIGTGLGLITLLWKIKGLLI